MFIFMSKEAPPPFLQTFCLHVATNQNKMNLKGAKVSFMMSLFLMKHLNVSCVAAHICSLLAQKRVTALAPYMVRVHAVQSDCPLSAPSSAQMESSSAVKTKNDKAWRNVSEEIKRIFRTAVLQLQEKGTMKSAQAKKFLCSGKFFFSCHTFLDTFFSNRITSLSAGLLLTFIFLAFHLVFENYWNFRF